MAEVITQSKTVRVSVNGQVIVTPDPSGIAMDALDQVTVNTSVPDEHIMKHKTITENGTYEAPEGTAYNKIVVDVDSAELEEITIEENGTYEPEEKDGYSKVIVDVQPTEEEKEALREEGRDEQLATDKAAVEALSPINENGSYDLLGAELAIDVQPNIFITNKQLTVGSNGTVVLTPTQMEGYDASYFSKVTIVTDVTPVLENKLIQANGIYTPAAGYDGFGKVTVDINASPRMQEKSLTVTENGSYSALPDTGYDALSKVDVEVNVQPDLEDKTFTSNGVYESSKDGFGKVTVQVQGGSSNDLIVPTAEGMAPIQIKAGGATEFPWLEGKTIKSVNVATGEPSSVAVYPLDEAFKSVRYNIDEPAASLDSASIYCKGGDMTLLEFRSSGKIYAYGDLTYETSTPRMVAAAVALCAADLTCTCVGPLCSVSTTSAASGCTFVFSPKKIYQDVLLNGSISASTTVIYSAYKNQSLKCYFADNNASTGIDFIFRPKESGTLGLWERYIATPYNKDLPLKSISTEGPELLKVNPSFVCFWFRSSNGWQNQKDFTSLCDFDWSTYVNSNVTSSYTLGNGPFRKMNIGSGSVAMCPVLSDIAGMTNYAGSELDLNYVPALTKQSLTNIVNTIGDVSTSESAHIFKVLATQQAMLTEAQIELLIDKGWTIQVA